MTNRQIFLDWVAELEERLAQYLFDHPEGSEQKMLTGVPLPHCYDGTGNKKVTVREGDVAGTWEVLLNGVCKAVFVGEYAHSLAMKAANELLQD